MIDFRKFACILPLSLLLSVVSAAQPTSASSPHRVVSLKHLYWHFLMYEDHVNNRADAMAATGHDAIQFRDSLRTRIGLNSSEYQVITKAAHTLATQVLSYDNAARAVVTDGTIPDKKTRLHTLTLQREGAIQSAIDQVHSALTTAQIAKLDSFLITFFSPTNATNSSRAVDFKSAKEGFTK